MRSWRRYKARLAYRREKAAKQVKPIKASKKKQQATPEFSGFCLLGLSILGTYCVALPKEAGTAGQIIAHALIKGLGLGGSYLMWLLIGYRGVRLILHREERRPWRYVLVDALLIAAVCGLIASFGTLFLDLKPTAYGLIGVATMDTLTQMFGRWGALFLSVLVVGALCLWRSRQHPRELVMWVWDRLVGDVNEWREAVAQQKSRERELAPKKALPRLPATPTPFEPRTAATAAPRIPDPEPVRKEPIFPMAKPTVVSQSPVPKAPPKAAPSEAKPAAVASDEPEIPFVPPSIDLLIVPDRSPVTIKEEDLLASAQHLEKTLADFGVQGKVVEIHPGPIITRFDFTPAPGVKVQAVSALSNDIALAMKALSVRILAPIPGKSAVGVELPNPKRAIVRLREVLESADFQNHSSKLALALGKDAEGHAVIADLATMPHLLIAGSTGAGKSVCIHALVMSLLYKSTPQEVKILMIDPKRLELPLYNGIPYLYDPNQNPENVRVITDAKEASKALDGMIKVMEHRFKKFAGAMARDIIHYNDKMASEGLPLEPYIVIIIDELADLMAVAPKEVEGHIQRLTQMARAVGIHMVLATQRPSVDVITGVIKANLPSRIAFRVASQTDSRVILDSSGAESLLGQGDMLFLPPGAAKPVRLQCGLVTSKEVQFVSDYVKSQGKPSYERVMVPIHKAGEGITYPDAREELDDLQQAMMLVLERRRVSQDLLKAHFGSSARATDLLSQLEVKGFISKPEGTNRWTIFFDRIDAFLGQVKNQATAPPEE